MQKTKKPKKKKEKNPETTQTKQNKTDVGCYVHSRGQRPLRRITARKMIKTPLNFAKINKNMHKKTGVKFWPQFSFKKEDSLWTLN